MKTFPFRTGSGLLSVLVAVGLVGCPSGTRPPSGSAGQPVPAPGGGAAPGVQGRSVPATGAPPAPSAESSLPPVASHLGRPYDVVGSESLLTILAYRAGALAKAGHNHVIASHDLSGTLYVPDDLMRTSVEIRVPVEGMTIDDASLRAKEGADFSAPIPDSAKDGTRHNMLGEAVLNAALSPQIVLQSESLVSGAAANGNVEAHIRVTVRQTPHSIVVPTHYERISNDEWVVSGELPLKQSDLGLTPFSALLGALQVQDEMRVRFRFVARAAGGR